MAVSDLDRWMTARVRLAVESTASPTERLETSALRRPLRKQGRADTVGEVSSTSRDFESRSRHSELTHRRRHDRARGSRLRRLAGRGAAPLVRRGPSRDDAGRRGGARERPRARPVARDPGVRARQPGRAHLERVVPDARDGRRAVRRRCTGRDLAGACDEPGLPRGRRDSQGAAAARPRADLGAPDRHRGDHLARAADVPGLVAVPLEGDARRGGRALLAQL